MKQPECEDKALLVAFLYDDCDARDRDRMEAHLAACAECAAELEGLRATRGMLGAWAPPEPALGFRVVREEVKRTRWTWPGVPVWAQAAAAVLVLAAGVGIANLDVTVGQKGVTIHTGWSERTALATTVPTPPSPASNPQVTALEHQLRAMQVELAALKAAPPASAPQQASAPVQSGTIDLAPVRMLIAQSEARQKNDFDRQLAARFVDFQRDVSSQQRAEFVRLQQGFTRYQQGTAADLASLRQAQSNVQNLLVRVANVNVQEIR